MKETQTTLPVDKIAYDPDNPRIKKALEKYGDKLTAERIHFALRSASDNGGRAAESYNSLKESIRASRGVMTPIVVTVKNDAYVCIDGNTRLAIYKQLRKEDEGGDWSHIKATVMTDVSQRDIEQVRVSAHLVGARQWPPYEKARYLHYLRNQEFMDYGEMVMLCGGNKAEIQRQIDAYHDMNEYYRDIVDDQAFQIDRFSGFSELQRPVVKQAIFDAGYDLQNFGEWIRDGKIFRLEGVRDLPRVLRDEEAREVFVNGGPRSIEDAVKVLEQRRGHSAADPAKVTLAKADIYQLATKLSTFIGDLTLKEITALQDSDDARSVETVGALENLADSLRDILKHVAE